MAVHTKIKNKLSDLKHCNALFPPDTDATGRLAIVPIHNHVDSQIQCDWNPRNGCFADQLSVAQKGSCSVVISMQKCKWLFLQH